jgi:hypothetical protein
VVRGAVATRVTVGAASGERFGRLASQESEQGAHALPRGAIATRRHELKFAQKSREHTFLLVGEDVVTDFEALGRRWRGW